MPMKIIISPAKKMVENTDDFKIESLPTLLTRATEILTYLKHLDYDNLKQLWKCNDELAQLNYERVQNMELTKLLTPAIVAYQGIQYQYMAPQVMEKEELEYLSSHLCILSALYGVLRPFDGVTPYRLEMQAKASILQAKDLYEYWGSQIYDIVSKDTNLIINLASKEYSKCIERYLTKEVSLVTCVFGELVDGKVKEKGTYAKMARGEMVRYMAEHKVESLEQLKEFHRLGYRYHKEVSNEKTMIFIKEDSNG